MGNIKLLITRWWVKFSAYNYNYQVDHTHPRFEKIKELLKDGNVRQAVILYKNPDKGLNKKSKKAVKRVKAVGNSIAVDGKALPDSLSNLYMKNVGKPGADALRQFLINFSQNPSQVGYESFARFLEHNEITITSRGTMLLYKRVNGNFMDLYTRSVDNSPGSFVSMPRKDVIKDPNQTCSYGYHCCAFRYLGSYGSRQDPVLVLEVDPRDVVSVPTDYQDSKIRVCRYMVWMSAQDFQPQSHDSDVLGRMRYFDIKAQLSKIADKAKHKPKCDLTRDWREEYGAVGQ